MLIFGLPVLLVVAASFILRIYTLDLIQVVVLQTVIQKSPQNYPVGDIRKTFSRARLSVVTKEDEGFYLERLLNLSQRLEKVQFLTLEELESLLLALLNTGKGSIVHRSDIIASSSEFRGAMIVWPGALSALPSSSHR